MQEQTRLSVGRARGRNWLCRQAAERGKSDVKRRPSARVDAWVREAGQRLRLLIAQTDKDNLQRVPHTHRKTVTSLPHDLINLFQESFRYKFCRRLSCHAIECGRHSSWRTLC